ncbi:MAG: glycosyltransferase family 2 protein [Gemmatimonadaceae bacterium]
MSDDAKPVVSVIMPFLNVARFLEEAIESVRAQTYPRWELLLCDDGATDGSSDIARRHAALDPARIRHLTHPDGRTHGASAARNLGIAQARGEVIALLDGDDVWFPTKLEEQLAILAERPDVDALYGVTELWYSWTGAPEDVPRDSRPPGGIPSNTLLAPRALLAGMLRRELLVPCTCSIVARADAVRRSGGFVDEFRQIYTDVAFYSRLSLVASVLYVERCWDRYRRHPASAYSEVQRRGEGREARLRWLTWLDRYLDETDARDDRELRVAVRASLRRVRHPRLFALVDRARGLLRRQR